MSLSSNVAALAERLADEFNDVRAEFTAAVVVPPRTMSASTTASVDGTAAGDMQITCTGNTVITPTGTPNGRMMVVECLASGAERTPSVATSVALTTPVASRSLTVPSGFVGVFGLRYSALAGTWLLMAASVEEA